MENKETVKQSAPVIVETGSFVAPSVIVSESEEYTVHRTPEGKYTRKAKYMELQTYQPETRAEKIWLLNLLEGVEDTAIGMKDYVNETIEIADIIIRKYDAIDEDTGEIENGVLTYLITPERQVYVTSAKAVYFSIKRIIEVFGKPGDSDWENVKVQVTKKKMENGDAINIKMIE